MLIFRMVRAESKPFQVNRGSSKSVKDPKIAEFFVPEFKKTPPMFSET